MIPLYPFQDRKEKIRIGSDYQVTGSLLTVIFFIDDFQMEIDDFYPLNSNTEKAGTICLEENLWQTTCFEIFLKNRAAKNYYEFNFNSKGEWNLFYFSNYRERVKGFIPSGAMQMSTQSIGKKNQLHFVFDLKNLAHLVLPCQVNLATVVSAKSEISYWSQKHNIQKPDFHDPENFSLLLNLNEGKNTGKNTDE